MLVSVSLIAIAFGFGCERSNPAFRGTDDGSGQGGLTGDGGDGLIDGGADATTDTGPTCVMPSDCTASNGGPPVCGAWDCRASACVVNCPNCTDNDHDGFGVGAGCAGPDCDDTNAAIHDTGMRACYDGPTGTAGKGTCRLGSQTCGNGVWATTCIGQVVPSAEACNGEDDDCNGTTDDNLPTFTCGRGACQNTVAGCSAGVLTACVPRTSSIDLDDCDGIDNNCDGQVDEDCAMAISDCIHVTPGGQVNDADGTVNAPFLSIQAAIAYAAATPNSSKIVCVAGSANCNNSNNDFTYLAEGATFQMANGVSVYGNYESRNWTRCPIDSSTPLHATIELIEAGGVRFPPTVTTPTTLDGFILTRSAAATTSAVTVNGAKQVRLSNLVINDAPQSMHSYGINLLNGGEALITHCEIEGGPGALESIGVRSVGSKPTIRENCAALDATTGQCTTACAPTLGLGIRGRTGGGTTGTSTAVHLEASPGALVETSTLCGEQSQQAVGVRLVSDATGTVIRGNMISATSGVTDSVGIWAEDCNNAAPWIAGNQLIEGQGGTRAVGVLGVGNCHPVIDSNTLITAGGQGNTTIEADGVACQANANNEPSLCAVLGNTLIQGSSNFRPATAAAVACRDKACVRVAGNIVQGNLGNDVIGIALRHDGTMIEQNRIVGGCGLQSAAGILADDSFARVQNNLISGGTCAAAAAASTLSIGLRVYVAADDSEMDVDSNTIDGGGNLGVCTSVGVEYGVAPMGTAPTAPEGIFRNNILRAGVCNTRSDFAEVRAASDPRLFENNDLDPTGPTVLYFDENTTALRTAAAVNALGDIASRNNLSVNPMFVAYPTDLHLGMGSACIGAGTLTGAPTNDFDGKARSQVQPSIGAYE